MKKVISLIVFILLVSLFFAVDLEAKNKKPKLKLPASKASFETSVESGVQGGIRGASNDCIPIENSPLPGADISYNQEFVTPNRVVIWQAKPLFQWKKPECNGEKACDVSVIETDSGNNILSDQSTDNTYVLDISNLKLLPEKWYEFTVSSTDSSDDFSIDKEICFQVLNNEKAEQFAKEVQALETKNKYDQTVAELNYMVDNKLWFDLVDKLQQALKKYPKEKELIEYKEQLYSLQ